MDNVATSENDVYRDRIQRAQQEMAARDVDYLFVTPSSDLIYLLGYPAHLSERLTLLGIPQAGEPFVVAPELEAVRLDNRKDLVDVHAWAETESPIALVGRLVEAGEGSTVVVSDQTWASFLLKLQSELDESKFESANEILRELRMIKDEAEIANIREASQRTERAWERFVESTTFEGKTERELGDALANELVAEGLSVPTFMLVGTGAHSASPHHITGETVVKSGDAIVFDFGARYNHYTSDITRMVHVGEPPEEYRQVYDIVLQANTAVREQVVPGMACERVDEIAREIITEAGYGEFFIHRVGHGLGLDAHEEPYMVGGNTMPLRPGMVFSDEPGIYLEGKFGVRIEDILVVTEDGNESFNATSRELRIVE